MNKEFVRRSITDDDIGIVACSDQNYAPYLAVMFYSLLKNCSTPGKIRLFCIDGGISDNTKMQMQNEVNRAAGNPIDFIRFDRRKYDELPVSRHVTSSAYYRIAIPEIFDDSVTKIIYLDCDMIVRGDITELWSLDVSNHHVGAVENLSGHTYRKLGIPQHEYFNSGMLLINLDLWRRDNISDQVFQFKIDNPDRISTNDQCALNGILHDKWKHLPLKWNHQTGLYRNTAQIQSFDKDEVEEAILNPQIIHYITWDKPWRKVRFHPLAEEYDRYADELTITSRQAPSLKDYYSEYASLSRLKKLVRRIRWRSWYRKQGFPLYKSSLTD